MSITLKTGDKVEYYTDLVFLRVFAFFALDIVISLISLLGYGIIEKISWGYLPDKSKFEGGNTN